MNTFPLQGELIDAVIAFANADLYDPAVVRRYFKGAWEPTEIPKLRACRNIQADVRTSLMNAADFGHRDCHDEMRGLEWGKGSFKRFDPGIRLEGWLSIDKVPITGGHKEQIVWKWCVSHASLRDICGLAVSTIVQENLHRRFGECGREGCYNIFLDRNSRGTPRKYCKQETCELALNRDRVSASRRGKGRRKK